MHFPIPARWPGTIHCPSNTAHVLQPCRPLEPLPVQRIVTAVGLDRAQEVVEPVHEVRIALANRPAERLARERFLEQTDLPRKASQEKGIRVEERREEEEGVRTVRTLRSPEH